MKWTQNWKKCKITDSIESGQSTVSKVINIFSGEPGALKQLHLDKLNNERKERFKGEIDTIKRLNLDRIPKIIEDSYSDETQEYYYISQWIEGETLSNYLNKNKVITIDSAIVICRKLCQILLSCHSQNIYHRDIKPDNIIVTKNQEVFLIDFGISHDEKVDFITPIGQELGNRFLKLPELAKGEANKADPRSDVTFVVGILFFLLYKSSPNQLLNQNSLPPHKIKQPSKINILSDPKWPLVELIFDIGLKHEIRDRFPSIQDLMSNLDSVMTFDSTKSSLEIYQTVSDFNKKNEFSLKDHHKIEELLRDRVNLLTKKIKNLCYENGFSEIHQLAKSEKKGRAASQLWQLAKKNHNEPFIFLNVIVELDPDKNNSIMVKLMNSKAEIKFTINKSYYQGTLYDIVDFSKESEKIANEMFNDAVKLLTQKIYPLD